MELRVLQAESGWEEKLEGAGNKDNEEELIHLSSIPKIRRGGLPRRTGQAVEWSQPVPR